MTNPELSPPRLFLRFFRWYCRPHLRDHIEGDLIEEYRERVKHYGKQKADKKFIVDVLLLFRPGILRPLYGLRIISQDMFASYFKVGWRNISRNQGHSLINIGGLALGLAVALLIGLYVWDEMSFNKGHEQYDRIAAVLQNQTYEGTIETSSSQSMQLGQELRDNYGAHFKRVVMSSFTASPVLTYGDKALSRTGYFMERGGPELFTLKMLKGSRDGLKNPNSILLSASTAKALCGNCDPLGEILKIDNKFDVLVTGVYEDLPGNSSFNDMLFVAPLDLLVRAGNRNLTWVNNWLEVYVELDANADFQSASNAIKNAKLKKVGEDLAKFNPELFLHPMAKWRLYSGFENGINTGGRIEMVLLFAIIGIFVLLLGCINFMNLSTARSERRAKEVGIRKVMGSFRGQLISQFFSESLMIVSFAFVLALVLVQLALPLFNEVASKNISMPWTNPWLWLAVFAIMLVTALISGSYPAFYLSGFRPGKVLKGTFRVGRNGTLPRKALVVVQFTISMILGIGTIVIYQQIQFAKNRPIGYDRAGLLTIPIKTPEVGKNYSALRNDLLASDFISSVSRSECMVTNMYWSDWGFQWKGKDPGMQDVLFRGAVDFDFGETVGWEIKAGRDFSRAYATDSSAMILNEAAVSYMGLKNPIGETVRAYGRDFTVIGVVEDMVSQSLYDPVRQTYYIIEPFNRFEFINVRINPQTGADVALRELHLMFKKHNPATPFEYRFADEQFAHKFAFEARIGKLAGVFATLAVVVSCLGLFGLASFVSEQRTKEIGIRKVVGASVFSLWKLLSKDFVTLVAIAGLIAVPLAFYLMEGWLEQYTYHTVMSWPVFGVTFLSVLSISIATVSYHALKVASLNPVQSLKAE